MFTMLPAAVKAASGGASYASVVAADSPKLWIRMQETATNGGAAANSGSFSTTATYALSTTDRPLQPGAPIVTGDALSLFTSTFSSIINIGSSAGANITSTNFYTVECWFKTTASGAYQMLVSADKSVRTFQLRINPSGNLELVNIAGATVMATSPGVVNDGTRHHAVATLGAGGVLTLYVDGVAVATTTNASMGGTVKNDADIACYGTNTAYQFKGQIAEAAIYEGALSAARVLVHWNAGK